eukprot:g16239.t1
MSSVSQCLQLYNGMQPRSAWGEQGKRSLVLSRTSWISSWLAKQPGLEQKLCSPACDDENIFRAKKRAATQEFGSKGLNPCRKQSSEQMIQRANGNRRPHDFMMPVAKFRWNFLS